MILGKNVFSQRERKEKGMNPVQGKSESASVCAFL